jgi:hypothetical protein
MGQITATAGPPVCAQCEKAIDRNRPVAFCRLGDGGRLIEFCDNACKKAYAKAPLKAAAELARRPPRKSKVSQSELRRSLEPVEQDLSRDAADLLDRRGVYNTRLQSGSIRIDGGGYMKLCRQGTPDRMFADGLVVFLELKRKGRKPTPEQVATADRLKENGALVFTVDRIEQVEIICRQLAHRYARIIQIRDAIRELQNEIDAKLYGTNADQH